MPDGTTITYDANATNMNDDITATRNFYTAYRGDTVRGPLEEPLDTYRTIINADWLDNIANVRDIEYGNRVTINETRLLTQKDLDEFAHRLYKIIEEHTPIDISEDEFMELIMNDR